MNRRQEYALDMLFDQFGEAREIKENGLDIVVDFGSGDTFRVAPDGDVEKHAEQRAAALCPNPNCGVELVINCKPDNLGTCAECDIELELDHVYLRADR